MAATRERVWHESLRAFPKKVEQLWFGRDWNEGSASYAWTPERPTGFQRDPVLEGYTLSNMLFLSKAVASNRPEIDPVFRWFKGRLRFLDLSARNRFSMAFTLERIQEKAALRDRILEMLRQADLGVTNARVIEECPGEGFEKIFATAPMEIRERFRKDLYLQAQLAHRYSGGTDRKSVV